MYERSSSLYIKPKLKKITKLCKNHKSKTWYSSEYLSKKTSNALQSTKNKTTVGSLQNISKNPYKVIKKNVVATSSNFTKFPFWKKNKPPNVVYRSFHQNIHSYKKRTKLIPSRKVIRPAHFKPKFKSKNISLVRSKNKVESIQGKFLQTKSSSFKQRQANKILKRSRLKKINKIQTHCIYYNRFGKCNRGDKCNFIHDPSRIALCTRFLNGDCQNTDCPFSHVINKSKVPTCQYFLKGKCSVKNCPYLHVFVGRNTPVCRQFALSGFCAKAEFCKEQHLLVCPNYYSTKKCDKGDKCPLPHKTRFVNSLNFKLIFT